MNAKKQVEGRVATHCRIIVLNMDRFGTKMRGGCAQSDWKAQTLHYARMKEMAAKPGKEVCVEDGDPESVFKNAATVIERSYSCPFLAHNCMEPMNFFAHVTDDWAKLAGPLQAPGLTEGSVAARLGMPIEKIDIELTRMGGGFGRRAYGHYAIEAALISKQANSPIKLVYSREDDMTCGIYRPSYHATYRAALDDKSNLIGFHVKGRWYS